MDGKCGRIYQSLIIKNMLQTKNNKTKDTWLKKPILSGEYRNWLIDAGSLTLRLQSRYQDFCVQPLMVAYAKANQDEIFPLKIKNRERVFIRNVFLIGEQMPVVFAHSVLPNKILCGRWRGLKELGTKPLGASLFSNPKVKRTTLNFKKIGVNHPLYQEVKKNVPKIPSSLWARRSVFEYQRANIMVTEVFLPTILTK